MKNLLTLVLALFSLASFGQTTLKTAVIAPAPGKTGSAYTVQYTRNWSTYPATTSGLNSLTTAIASGSLNLTVVSSGCVIAAGTRPPTSPPVCSDVPAWLTALQWKHDGTTMSIQANSNVETIAFNTVPASNFTASNPDGVQILSGVDYGYGQVSNGNYTRQWQINKAPTTFALTLKNGSGSSYTSNFTASVNNTFTALIGTATNPGGAGDSRPFCAGGPTVVGLTVNSASSLSVQYNGTSLTSIDWKIEQSGSVVRSGNSGTLTTSTFGISLGTALPDGSYTLVLDGTVCKTTDPTAARRAFTVSTGTTPVITSAANLPSWETFDYQPITTNTTWTEFDSRVDKFGKQVGEQASLELNGITVRVRKRHGGAPTHISRPGGSNMINIHDLGTMNGYALYRGGLISPNPSAVINTQWAQPPSGGVGNDPIQHGDVYDNPSEILAYGRNATTIYTKTAMKNWAVQNETTDAIMEQWVKADPVADYVVHVYTKVTYNRTDDKNFYEFEAQEYPCVYTGAAYRRLRYVDANGNLNQLENQAGQFDLNIRKPWVALENVYDNTKAIGLWSPGMYLSTQWQKSVEDGADEFSNGAGYTANRAFIQAAWNDVWYGHHAFIVGDANKIRTWAEAQPDPRNKISWKFNERNGIGHFGIKNGVTSGFPTPNTGVEITKTTSQNEFYIKWPYMAVPATGISKLYMYYKATGPSTNRVLRFQKSGQQEIDAQQANQEVQFQTINDNTWRTAEINVGSNGGWNNTISLLKLLDANQPEGAKITIGWFNTSNTDPEP
ncbi:hypothetical protein [Spirosoma sp.]|uniref:hypothetical protein n=1 Tax=Spirosoma sp. TaxID=1899569 RepID=UPI002624B3FC|nr:hypothetical protein [Spirosoma sp.]MCX6218332.1 hypothetical protein [Spirosoma sp.]